MALTDTEIRRSRPGDKPYRLADGQGLFLLVTSTGGRLWRWKYRFEGKEKLMALGQYPDVRLADARDRLVEARRLLASGVDPMATRKAEKATKRQAGANSFRAITSLWLEHWRADKSPRHADTTQRRLEANVFPILGARPISQIEPRELVAMVKMIEARGAGDLAKRALETTGQVFRYAIAHGFAARNPAAEFKPSDVLRPTKKVNLAHVDAKETPRPAACNRGLPGQGGDAARHKVARAHVCAHQ